MAQRARGVGTGSRAAAAGRPASNRTAGGRRPVDTLAPQPLGRAQLVALRDRLRELIEPVVTAGGLDLEDVMVSRMGRRYLVRVTVDADGGVGHDELSDVSRAVSRALDDAEDSGGELTPDAYTLELSSPGIDRPLTLPRHWRRNLGRLVAVRVDGRQLTGRVSAVDEHGVSLDVNGQRVDAAFAALGPGRVQVEFTRLAELSDEEFGPELTEDESGSDSDADGPAFAARPTRGGDPRTSDAEDES